MARILRRTRSVLRAFDPNKEFWHDAEIIVEEEAITLETHWRNPELAGIWLVRYRVSSECFLQLRIQNLIEREKVSERIIYRLSAEGKKRLGQS